MRPLSIHLAYKNLRRLRTIVAIMTKHGFRPIMERLHLTRLISATQWVFGRKREREKEELTLAVRARLAMEELGPTFIKLGQILSTRPDIIPEEFILEMLKLQDSVAPFAFKDVLAVIESEFNRPASELFSSIEETPAAAASIAQVHRAVTASGKEVVIKVQRPGIEATIETDIAILGYLARLAVKYIPESRLYDPVGVVEEFSRVIIKEMDFTLEGSYMEKFRANFAKDGRVLVPDVHWELSGRRVLTMERVRGIKVDNVEKLKAAGIDTEKVAHLLADVFFKQVFDFGLFHGDLHSGNIFVIDADRIAFVDYGIVGRIDDDMKQNLADILICFATDNFEGLTKVYQRMKILPEHVDRASFEREYYDIMLRYFGRPFKSVKIGELMMDYIKLAARHDVMLPRELLLFDKCLIELEGLARVLFPAADILSECKPYASRLYSERFSPVRAANEAVEALAEYKDLFKSLPAQTGEILKKLSEDRIRIEFMHRGLEDFMGEVDRSSNRLTFGIIMAALVIGSSMVLSSESGPIVFGYPALGILGFLVASLLGLWLAFQILKSGKF